MRHELTVHNGFVIKDCSIVVPTSLRKNIIATVQSSHQGIQGCIRLAKVAVYWPLMNQEITDYVSQCSVCNMHRTEQITQCNKSAHHLKPLAPGVAIHVKLPGRWDHVQRDFLNDRTWFSFNDTRTDAIDVTCVLYTRIFRYSTVIRGE